MDSSTVERLTPQEVSAAIDYLVVQLLRAVTEAHLPLERESLEAELRLVAEHRYALGQSSNQVKNSLMLCIDAALMNEPEATRYAWRLVRGTFR